MVYIYILIIYVYIYNDKANLRLEKILAHPGEAIVGWDGASTDCTRRQPGQPVLWSLKARVQ